MQVLYARTAGSLRQHVVTLIVSTLLFAGASHAEPNSKRVDTQVQQKRLNGRVRPKRIQDQQPPAKGQGQPQVVPDKSELDDNPFIRGASLQTDSDVDDLIDRALEYLPDQRYREAVLILQHVIEESGSVLSSEDGRVYRPVRNRVEQVLATLSPEGLQAYRLMVDGQARGLMKLSDPYLDEDALTEVVRRYFLSTWGDDAAFQLGSLNLDRYDFVGARQLFQKLLTVHPDPTPSRNQVLARLVIASVRAGDGAGASRAWRELEQNDFGNVPHELMLGIKTQMEEVITRHYEPSEQLDGWRMELGTSRRDGYMPALAPASDADTFWTAFWDYRFGLVAPSTPAIRIRYRNTPSVQRRSEMLRRWRMGGWHPATQLILHDGMILFKSHRTLICCDTQSGRKLWEIQEPDPVLQNMMSRRRPRVRLISSDPEQPVTAEENLLFADRLGKSMALIGQTLYHLEGQAWNSGHHYVIDAATKRHVDADVGNALAAYDVRNGELRWRIGGKPYSGPDVQYLAAPVSCGNNLVVPMVKEGALFLVGLERDTGATLWNTFLCSGLPDSQVAQSPVGTAVDGRHIFVASGRGVIFCVDGSDGSIAWASRYPRSPNRSRMRGQKRSPAVGWDQDTIIPHGTNVIVLPSDADSILSVDRTSGTILFDTVNRRNARYCLGVVGDALFVAGMNMVRCYDLSDTRQRWETRTGRASGRGLLTAQHIYIPVDDRIERLELANGHRSREMRIAVPWGDPLGNLFCDGQNLYGTGMEHVYALVDTVGRLKELNNAITTKDRDDIAERLLRARLRRQVNQLEGAVEDYRYALAHVKNSNIRQETREQLFDTLLQMAQSQSGGASLALEQAQKLSDTPIERVRVKLASAQNMVRLGQPREALEEFLRIVLDQNAGLIRLPGKASRTTVLASAMAAEQIVALLRNGDAEVSSIAQQIAQAAFDAAYQRADTDNMVQITRAFRGTPVALRAALSAAAVAVENSNIEQAELILREMQRSHRRRFAATALAELAKIYESAGWTEQAIAKWMMLKQQYSGVTIVADGTAVAPEIRAESLSEERLAALTATSIIKGNNERRIPDPPWKRLWEEPGPGLVAIDFGLGFRSEFLDDHLLLASTLNNRLTCRNVHTGQDQWTIDLPVGAGPTSAILGSYIFHGHAFPAGSILRDGHMGLLWSGDQITMYGLVNGRKQWSHSIAAPKITYATLSSLNNLRIGGGFASRIAVANGLIGLHEIDPESLVDQIRVIDVATGKERWSRRFDREPVDGVAIAGGYVSVLLNGGQEVWSADQEFGTEAGRFSVSDRRQRSGLVWTRFGLLQQGPLGVTLRSLPTGNIRWIVRCRSDGGFRVEQLDEQFCCAVAMGGRSEDRQFLLIDLTTGETKFQAPLETLGRIVREVVLSRNELYVLGLTPERHWQMTIIDVTSGSTTQVVFGPPASQRLSASLFAASGDLIPILMPELPKVQEDGRKRWTNLFRIVFHNRSNGEPVEGLNVPVIRKDGKLLGVRHDPIVKGTTLILTSHNGVMAFGHDGSRP